MSYILEALKKAQAERQLGNAPTIHAPQVAPVTPAAHTASRKPLLIGLGAGALCVAAGALVLWRSGAGLAPAAAPAVAPAATAVAAASRSAPAAVAATAPGAPAAAPDFVAAPAPAASAPPVATTLDVSAPPASVAPAPRPPQDPQRDASSDRAVRSASEPAAAAANAPRPAPAATASAPARQPVPEDNLPLLQQLPDAMQRDMPRVTFGGYMYSANPSDRLLLVDKALRREGEEVAPGLVLEKLLPKAAVMNYRGVRYRVGL